MKLGIVGLPNVGKSTLFNAITSTKNAEAANYPFCTIEPNSGIVAVPDKRLDKLAEIWQTNKKTPAIVEFVDIAGLVKGASQGAGLGNKFLGHIRECDAIVHVVRCFDDDNIIHVVEDVTKAEAVDPIADIDAIDYELILSDLEVVQNRAGRMAKAAKSGNNKGAAAEAAWLQQLADHLSAGKPARSFDFDEGDAEQQTVLHEMGLLSAKPVLYACNVGEDDLMEGIENNQYVPLVAARAKEEGARYIPICAKTEEDIADYSPEEKKAFLAEMGIEASGLDNLITASYELLAEHSTDICIEAPAQIIGLQVAKTERGQRVATGTISGGRDLLIGDEEFPGLLEMAATLIHSGNFYGNPRSNGCGEKYCPIFNTCKWRR